MGRSAYMCNVECSLIAEGEHVIDPLFIKYIAIDYQYQTTYMPVIYLMAKLQTDLYDKVTKHTKDGKIYIRIDIYNAYSASSVSKRNIAGQFTYIVADSNPNYTQDLSNADTSDNSYHSIQIALMSMEIMNKFRTSFNGIYGNIDQNTLVAKAVEGLNIVVKPLLYNPKYETIEVPALNSKMKLLAFLFNKCPFYDTNYMFFMDFDKAYLTDLTGKSFDARDGQLSSVYFDIKQFTVESSYYEGMETQNGAYYVYINPRDVNIAPNRGTDKVANQYVFIDDDGKVDYVDLDINNNVDSDTKQAFRRGEAAVLYKNIAESNTVVVELVKENIDSSVITPNKEFIIAGTDDYSEYNGNYTLLGKQEFFVNNSGTFGMSTTVRLRKVGNVTSIGQQVAEKASLKSRSPSAKYSSSKSSGSSSKAAQSKGTNIPVSSKTKSITLEDRVRLPTTNRIKATSDMSLKRSIRTLQEEG